MQLTARAHLVGSGRLGLTMTDVGDCNVFLVDGGSEVALIDSGSGYRSDLLLEAIEQAGFSLPSISKVLLTHKHADHSGGAASLRQATGARIYATAETASAIRDGDRFTRNLERAKRAGAYPDDYEFRGVEVDELVSHGDRVDIGDLSLTVHETPGHCAGHCSFEYETEGRAVLASGDAVLPLGQIVIQSIPDCSPFDSVASIEALAATDWDVLLPGHLAPVLQEARWHLDAALERVRRGRLPKELFIPESPTTRERD
jgi:glyoxylase-like metal-dependent hydrolase (beta-lactamase superfamily II)